MKGTYTLYKLIGSNLKWHSTNYRIIGVVMNCISGAKSMVNIQISSVIIMNPNRIWEWLLHCSTV